MEKKYIKKIPVIKNKVCVYAICKNEKQFVEQWLESMSEADYIAVLDTGSTDGTYEMLKADPRVTRCEQKIISPWRFDVARNESMKLIPEDANILFCTDLDELLDKGWADVLRENWIEGIHSRGRYSYAWSHTESGKPARIFSYSKIHNKDWCWQYPVHEQLTLIDNNKNFDTENEIDFNDKIYLHHWPDNSKSRSNYLNLLKIRVEENSNDYESKLYLAHEYFYNDQCQNSINVLKEILEQHDTELSSLVKSNCYLFMGNAYNRLNELGFAIGCYYQAIIEDETYREPYCALGSLFNYLEKYELSIVTLEECERKTYRHYSWLEQDSAWVGELEDLLGVAYYWIGDYEKSYINTLKALEFNKDNERLIANLKYAADKLGIN